MKQAPVTHIEVTEARGGEQAYGIKTGQLLTVDKETKCFFFVRSWTGKQIKVSKRTKRSCYWSNANTSPVFNI
jgi:hypothetical protein